MEDCKIQENSIDQKPSDPSIVGISSFEKLKYTDKQQEEDPKSNQQLSEKAPITNQPLQQQYDRASRRQNTQGKMKSCAQHCSCFCCCFNFNCCDLCSDFDCSSCGLCSCLNCTDYTCPDFDCLRQC